MLNVLNKDLSKVNKNYIQYLVQLNTLGFLLKNKTISSEKYIELEKQIYRKFINK